MDIKEDPRIKEFLTNRDLAKGTEKRYLIIINHYCESIGLTPTEFILEAEQEEDKALRMRYRKIKPHLNQFKEYLELKGHSELNISTSLTIIRTFYHEFEIFLPLSKNKKRNIKVETIENLPTIENIRYALNFANIKYQSIILTMVSSGMGSAEIINLTYHDFLKSIKPYVNDVTNIGEITSKLGRKHNNNELMVGTWHIMRVKTRKYYTTFTTYESIKAILLYLKAYPITSENDYLFRSQHSNSQINSKTFSNYFNYLNSKCGFGKTHRQIYFRSHNLRKLFATTLYKKKLPELVVHWLLGHRIDAVTEAYFKADINSLREQYITCISDLSIEDTETRVLESQDKKRLDELEIKYDKLLKIMEDKDGFKDLP
jgi:integrase